MATLTSTVNNPMKFYLIRPKEESSSIIADVFYQKKRIRIATGLVIPPKAWDDEKQKVTSKFQMFQQYNVKLSNIRSQIESLVSNYKIRRDVVSKDELQ